MDLGNLIFKLRELLNTVSGQSGTSLEATMSKIAGMLRDNTELAEYEVARFLVYRPFKTHIHILLASDKRPDRLRALEFIKNLYPPGAAAKLLRKLVKDPDSAVRSRARHVALRMQITDVAIQPPRDTEPWATAGQPINDWHRHGWTFGTVAMPVRPDSLARHSLPVVSNKDELATLLGFSLPDLPRLLRPGTAAGAPYVQFHIDKANGSKRQICAPRAELKSVQRSILEHILSKIPAHDACHGFTQGRSTLTNASPHQGAAVIIKMDLEDFFPTIHYWRVEGFFRYCGYDDEVASTLASLCTFRATSQSGKARWPGVLPQGAPSSPSLANLICVRMDKRLQGVANRYGATYTRYADDLTFSFASEPASLGRFQWWVDQICGQEGFSENLRKRRVLRPNNQQRITGVVVNSGLSIPRQARRRFRAILNNCRKHGVASQARGHDDFPAYLRGFAAYIHMVQPTLGKKLLAEVDSLLAGTP